ncbi:MAG: FdtA/QdtA family cupin domain-containing protein [Verrucomicrobiae bacterium]|nr:FdtA/QdtA family cupin domain-containing protein [Verrucomicrobiae bacterium]
MEEEPQLIRLRSVPHRFGELVVAEGGPLPFEPRRTYFVHGIPAGATRGGHAHRRTREAIIPLRGSFRVSVARPGGSAEVFRLSDPRAALLIPAHRWVVLDEFSDGASFLVVASEPYDEADYIRDRAAFEGLGAGGCAG